MSEPYEVGQEALRETPQRGRSIDRTMARGLMAGHRARDADNLVQRRSPRASSFMSGT